MSDAPERIWLTNFVKDEYGARLGRGTISDLDHGPDYKEYVRADRIEALEAKLAKAVEALTEAANALDWCAREGRMASPGLHAYPAKWSAEARAALDEIKGGV